MRVFTYKDTKHIMGHEEYLFWTNKGRGAVAHITEVKDYLKDKACIYDDYKIMEIGDNLMHLFPLFSLCYNLDAPKKSRYGMNEAKVRE